MRRKNTCTHVTDAETKAWRQLSSSSQGHGGSAGASALRCLIRPSAERPPCAQDGADHHDRVQVGSARTRCLPEAGGSGLLSDPPCSSPHGSKGWSRGDGARPEAEGVLCCVSGLQPWELARKNPSLVCSVWLLMFSWFCPGGSTGDAGRAKDASDSIPKRMYSRGERHGIPLVFPSPALGYHPESPPFRGSRLDPSSDTQSLTPSVCAESWPPNLEHQVPCRASQGTLENPQG